MSKFLHESDQFLIQGLQALLREKNSRLAEMDDKIEDGLKVYGFLLELIVKSGSAKWFLSSIKDNKDGLPQEIVRDMVDYIECECEI